MALNDNELFNTVPGKGAEIRMVVHRNKVGTLAGQTDAPLLPKGTPLAWNTSTGMWTVFTQGGTNGTNAIRGFVQDAGGVQTHATNEVQVVVMLEGEIHRDDVNTAAIRAVLGGSPSEANIDTALQSQTLRELGIHVRGLDGVS